VPAFFLLLIKIDDQQGMTLQLERALSEALEEELTRELALIIEPVMIKIKGCIPAILESCRQKLISLSLSSNEEIVSASSSTPSGTGNGDSGSGGLIKRTRQQARHGSNYVVSQHLGNSFEAVPTADVPSKKGQKECPDRPTPSTSDVRVDEPQEIPPPESNTKWNTSYQNVSPSPYDFPGSTTSKPVNRSYSMAHGHNLDIFSTSFPGDSDPLAGNHLADYESAYGTIFEPYDDAEVLSQQNYESLSEFLLPMWPLQGDEWECGNTIQ